MWNRPGICISLWGTLGIGPGCLTLLLGAAGPELFSLKLHLSLNVLSFDSHKVSN